MVKQFEVRTRSRVDFIDITREVRTVVRESATKEGTCVVYVPHTTAAVTINENADPDVVADIKKELEKIVPFEDDYRHAEGNSAAHIKTSILGASETIIIDRGELVLGTWQGIYLCEFDGPRTRRVVVRIA
ncbi:MAG: secondary thiamine-phosphate synthase enzyme YjbQ [bacterium]